MHLYIYIYIHIHIVVYKGISPQQMALYGTVPPFKDPEISIGPNLVHSSSGLTGAVSVVSWEPQLAAALRCHASGSVQTLWLCKTMNQNE